MPRTRGSSPPHTTQDTHTHTHTHTHTRARAQASLSLSDLGDDILEAGSLTLASLQLLQYVEKADF